jgi:hypothetical protein
VPTAAVHKMSMSMNATCNQSLSNAAPSIVYIAQKPIASHTNANCPVGSVDVIL